MLRMIVIEKELEKYLGNDLDSLDGKVRPIVLEKLRRYDVYTTENHYLPLIDYLFLAHQHGDKPLGILSEEIGISVITMYKIFNFYGLPKLNRAEGTRRKWQDTEFRKRQGEAVSRPWLNPEFRARNAEGVRRNNKDPQFIERRLKGLRRKMADPQYIENQAVGARTSLNSMRYEPGFRERQAAASSKVLHRINRERRILSAYKRGNGDAGNVEARQRLIDRISKETNAEPEYISNVLSRHYGGTVERGTTVTIQDTAQSGVEIKPHYSQRVETIGDILKEDPGLKDEFNNIPQTLYHGILVARKSLPPNMVASFYAVLKRVPSDDFNQGSRYSDLLKIVSTNGSHEFMMWVMEQQDLTGLKFDRKLKSYIPLSYRR